MGNKLKYYDTFVIVIDKPLRKGAYLSIRNAIEMALRQSIESSGRLFACNADEVVEFNTKEIK